jgi:hypothetical protein
MLSMVTVIVFAAIVGLQIHASNAARNTARGLNWSLNALASELADVRRTLKRNDVSSSPPFAHDTQFDVKAQAVAKMYNLNVEQARDLLLAFNDLLHIDRSEQGLARFVGLGSLAGPFLLDELQSTPMSAELRLMYISNALQECLTPDVESALIRVAQNDSSSHLLRKHAVSALSEAQTPVAHEFLVGEFLRLMELRPRERWNHPYYRSIIGAVGVARNPATVDALLKLINEEKDGNVLDNIRGAITALGKIGDPRATPVLKDLVKHPQWRVLTPTICLALARIGDPEALVLAHEAQEGVLWTSFNMATFKQVEEEVQRQRNQQKSGH